LTLQTPSGTVAPAGYFDVTLDARSIALEVDDKAVLDGVTVPVTISDFPFGGEEVERCVPVRERRTIDLGSLRDRVFVRIGPFDTTPLPTDGYLACTGVATVGTVRVG
jgi:hypothetical protein